MQVDLFHQGKKDADDHKVVHERLLNLAVPPDPEGKGIKLEDCLEEYLTTKSMSSEIVWKKRHWGKQSPPREAQKARYES